jgi:glycine dehydrogenase subunit 1
MPFIPHTQDDIESMLSIIGVKQLSDLFDEIPKNLMAPSLSGLPPGMSEMQVGRLMKERATLVRGGKCFIGAGAYEHHIPGVVWDITQRGEYLTGYTPYQAEVSQGILQLLWEYQTMMASLMGMEVSNASLYDGASALVEAVLMAIRSQKKEQNKSQKNVWVAQSIHPYYRQVLSTFLTPQNINIIEIPFCAEQGVTTVEILNQLKIQEDTCMVLVLGQPNFMGLLEDVNSLTNWGHEQGAMVIGVVNPVLMAWLKPPGQWGKMGADIACGEGQPLGVPLASGGPYFGFLCSRREMVRQLPGRLVGRTVDTDGNEGFTLTLQAREQHIRRGKATSNICTNQGLLVTAATIYMSLLAAKGLKQLAQVCHQRMQRFIEAMRMVAGVSRLFLGNYFHETVWQMPVDVNEIIIRMQEKNIACGVALESFFPNVKALKNTLLVCVTETKTQEDIGEYVTCLQQVINEIKKLKEIK